MYFNGPFSTYPLLIVDKKKVAAALRSELSFTVHNTAVNQPAKIELTTRWCWSLISELPMHSNTHLGHVHTVLVSFAFQWEAETKDFFYVKKMHHALSCCTAV
ncbi:hypothetical protein GDO81_013353 [Engystomops pustulosus]|uniref:Uncharacterized protein n=1 Tax=Engystomops pustulosus TaxID=76066 RepID=A0AAV7AYY5_ENGPU|nr:hypothetical protein GDO81_013353 [Engystomops pustulosus]